MGASRNTADIDRTVVVAREEIAFTTVKTDVVAPAQRVRDGAVVAEFAVGFVGAITGATLTTAFIAPLSEHARATTSLASGHASVRLPRPEALRD